MIPTAQAHHSGFGISSFSFALDIWRRHSTSLLQLALFAADARQPDAKEALALEGVQPAQFPLAMQLTAAATVLSRRNRLLRRAADECGIALRGARGGETLVGK